MPTRNHDEDFLRQALELARRGIGLTSPNPNVGAVIVAENGEVVGTGTHIYDGLKHAEVLALEQAGPRARGATLYVNLEPCSHQGRTPPCADAIIAAGIRRVVAGVLDPNPLVSGRGFQRLREAGVSVASGLLVEDCLHINEAFANYIRRRVPLVTLKTAMTLDGKIAPPPGESGNPTALGSASVSGGWITSEVARAAAAAPERRHPGGRRHDHRRRSAADRSQRASPPPAPAACDRGFTPALAVGIAPCENGPERRARGLLLRRREPQAGAARSRYPRRAAAPGHARRATRPHRPDATAGRDGDHQLADRRWGHDQLGGVALGDRRQGVFLLCSQDPGRDRSHPICHRHGLQEPERRRVRPLPPPAPLWRRLCRGRLFARSLSGVNPFPGSSGLSGFVRVKPFMNVRIVVLISFAALGSLFAQSKPPSLIGGLGPHHHPITTQVPEAQRFFDQGLTLVYAFNHEEAERSFRRAAQLDPQAAMAFWGIALALGPCINLDVDPLHEKAAFEAVQKALSLADGVTEIERAYIQALATRYSADPRPNRRQLDADYAGAMRHLAQRYPDDLDAATLYAESLMDLRPWKLWSLDGQPAQGTQEIVAVLESVLRRDPNHLGANHYYIHATEASLHPEWALPSARRLESLA